MKKYMIMTVVALAMSLTAGCANAGGFSFCVNGVDMSTGNRCDGNGIGNSGPMQFYPKGREALEVILNSRPYMASGVDQSGWSHYVGVYNGNQFPRIRNLVFNCKVSPNAQQFECVSWPK